jgi:tRNA(His) 5'-end guanylyltransferase
MKKVKRKFLSVPLKVRALEKTRSYCKWKLREKGLTEKERDKYLKSLKAIDRIIQGIEKAKEVVKKGVFLKCGGGF